MSISWRRILQVLGVLVAVGATALATYAGENALGLSDQVSYDIYIGTSEDSVSIIRDVAIAGLKEIGDKAFLIIYSDTFAKKTSEGLISLDFVRAIIPAHKTIIFHGTQGIHLHQQP